MVGKGPQYQGRGFHGLSIPEVIITGLFSYVDVITYKILPDYIDLKRNSLTMSGKLLVR